MSKTRQRFQNKLTFFDRKLIIVALLFFSVGSRVEGVVYGPQFRSATLSSVDMLSSQLTLMQAQSLYNKVLSSASFSYVYAPAEIFMNDGSIIDGAFTRSIMMLSAGYGKINKFGVFGGLQLDWVKEKTTSNDPNEGGYFLGLSIYNFQLTMAYIDQNGPTLDGNYDFTLVKNQQPSDNSGWDNYGLRVFSVYHKIGLYASATFSDKPQLTFSGGERETYMSESKINFQPLQSMLPSILGLPFLDYSSYTPNYSYSGDIRDYYDGVGTEQEKRHNLQIGADNLFNLKIRSSLTMQVSPEVNFKMGELAYVIMSEKKNAIAGIRTQVFDDGSGMKVGYDSYLLLSIAKKYVNVSFSYSYNSPQRLTFIPLDDLHVFGVQFILGRRETAKAIIPFAASSLAGETTDAK
ncbi:MAG: hypothetical protein JNL74_10460 [Fibrobacteres bacterium]|nr:hypothetical protein [Fibrobacterota bacterium]